MPSGSRHSPSDSAGSVATPQSSRSFWASSAVVESGPVVVAVSISTRSCDGSFTERSALRTARLTPFSLRASTSRASVVRWSLSRPGGSSCSTANFTTMGSAFGRAARNRSLCFANSGVRPRPAIRIRANCCEGRLSPRSNTWRSASSRASSSVGSVTRKSATASRNWVRCPESRCWMKAFGAAQAAMKCSSQRRPGRGWAAFFIAQAVRNPGSSGIGRSWAMTSSSIRAWMSASPRRFRSRVTKSPAHFGPLPVSHEINRFRAMAGDHFNLQISCGAKTEAHCAGVAPTAAASRGRRPHSSFFPRCRRREGMALPSVVRIAERSASVRSSRTAARSSSDSGSVIRAARVSAFQVME